MLLALHTLRLMELRVVFGAGQVGDPLAQFSTSKGTAFRVVRRRKTSQRKGIEQRIGDAFDPCFCIEAAAGGDRRL